MKKVNFFFKKRNKIYFFDVLSNLNIKAEKTHKNSIINDIQSLEQAKKNDITFFHSLKYKDSLIATKSNFILTNTKLSKHVPSPKVKIIVQNVLLSVAKLTEFFYPNSLEEQFEKKMIKVDKEKKYKNVKFGSNVLIGENVKIGINSKIGHNSIIESNVIIGKNCNIGSNVVIRKTIIGNDVFILDGAVIGKNCNIGSNVVIKKTIIGNDVFILDGAVIGKKGFGFFPNKKKNIRYPHIGMVIIGNNVEIGCNNTIDRGSLSNTIIGDNSFLDNQVHIAHNVKIGNNCVIAGQVGVAGSTTIGHNVMIGGQAGISGHLKIGNNVRIAGGSGVIKNIPDSTNVMGYPAKDIKKFILENK